MSGPTHRYTGTGLLRADGSVLETDAECTPTDAELSAFGDSFEPLPDAGDSGGDDEADNELLGEKDMTVSEAKAVLDDAGIAPDDYRALQKLAGDFEGVPGNAPQSELQVQLAEKLREQG